MKYINVDKVLSQNADLHILEYDDNHSPRCIGGSFEMNSNYNDVFFCERYQVEVDLTRVPPSVKETGRKISSDYTHRYSNGGLCLEAPANIITTCVRSECFDFDVWFKCFLIPYFFSYEYFKLYHSFPFGERSHGMNGILEYYMELFHLSNIQQAREFVVQVSRMSCYRGHHMCPCGSGLKIRNCHSDEVKLAMTPVLKECILFDTKELCRQ